MLTSLRVSNFKAWQEINDMRLAPITGLFGTNSSGKSSILQLLLLLKQTAESTDRRQILNFGSESDYVRLGGFKDIIYSHDEQLPIDIQLGWTLAKNLNIYDPTTGRSKAIFTGCDMGFKVDIIPDESGRHEVHRIEYRLAENSFWLQQKVEKGRVSYELDAATQPENNFRFIRNPGRPWPIKDPPTKCYGFPDPVNAYHQNAGFLSDLELAFEKMLGRIYYLGPLRDFPKRDYRWSGGEPSDVGRRGEFSIDALLAGRGRATVSPGYRKRKQTIEERVAYWLQELGLIESFTVRQIAEDSNLYEVRVKKDRNGPDVLIPDVGFGVSQILPVLVLCCYAPEGSTLLFEQPEIHLHPSVQSGLADVFIDVAKNRKMQIIVESHSEHLLTRLQRRIAEGEDLPQGIKNSDAALYFCETADGESKLIPLEIDLMGNIRNWPSGFFGDRFGEVAARQEAGLRRQAEAEKGNNPK